MYESLRAINLNATLVATAVALATIVEANVFAAGGSKARFSGESSTFGEEKLGVLRIEELSKSPHQAVKQKKFLLSIVGCFPNSSGEGANGGCSPKHKIGDHIRPLLFLAGKIYRDFVFTYRKLGHSTQFVAEISRQELAEFSSPAQGFVADPTTLKSFQRKLRNTKRAGQYKALKVPASYAELGLTNEDPFPKEIDRYDLDGDGLPEFLFLRPLSAASDGYILIHEPDQNNWIIFDNGCC